MVILDDDTYVSAKNIALGTTPRSQIANDFATWAASNHAIEIIDAQLHESEPPSKYGYTLRMIIANTQDYQKTNLSPWKRNEQLLTEMAEQYLVLAAGQSDTASIRPADLFVVCVDFSQEAMTEANWRATKEFGLEVKRKHPAVWDVISEFYCSVVFYFHETDIIVHEDSGLSQALRNEYYSILKTHDDLNLFSKDNICLKFDSKENVDRNYAGSLFYYSRG
ncbi:MAG: hypothetical protein KDI03_21285 [Anaerolineae bacterium]|nr:hypothetical protein [Anaerolineae bacterium]MCB0206941.1 hypothetical protein [Anaerolineae bacterium]